MCVSANCWDSIEAARESSHNEYLMGKLDEQYTQTPFYFWERGLNEHMNGLLRQFFPKQTNFRIVKPEALEKAIMLINNRPRKSLDYKTPVEVLYGNKSDTVVLQI